MFKKLRNLLLHNTSRGQTIVKNTFWVSFGQIGSRLLRLVLVIYAARLLGATEYGVFSYALAVAGFLTAFSDFGLTAFITRESARDPERRTFYIATSLALKLSFVTLGSLLIFLLIKLLPTDSLNELSKAWWIVIILFAADTLRSFFTGIIRSFEKMEAEAGLSIATNALLLIIGGGFLLIFKTSTALLTGYALASVLGLLIFTIYLRNELKGWLSHIEKNLFRPILTEAWPFGALMVLNTILLSTDTLMLGSFRTITEVGWYSAAQRVIIFTAMFAGFWAVSLFPALSRAAKEDKADFAHLFQKGLTVVTYLALPICVGGVITSGGLISTLFGEQYSAATLPLMILMLMIPFTFSSAVLNNGMFALGRQKSSAQILLTAAILNILLNLLLIPKWGMVGAAVTTVTTQALSTIMSWWVIQREVTFTILGRLGIPFISVVVMGAGTFYLQNAGVPLWLVVMAGAIVYGGSLYLLKDPLIRGILRR